MGNYHELSEKIIKQIEQDRKEHVVFDYACRDEDVIRKYDNPHDYGTVLRPAFVRDVEKIMHNPYYTRYADKTQVFSFIKNDDISRRAQHVQLVARIARNISRILGLNEDLTEAIALGHDIGHTPFGHAGERNLSDLYQKFAGRYFNHNIQSARVFNTIFPSNISMQTLDGIICHNGELELKEYRPKKYDRNDFVLFEQKMEEAYTDQSAIERMIPCTLEGCVVRVSDIIAYVGKDRHDAEKIGMIDNIDIFDGDKIGRTNSEIINNMTVNIIENSYGKSYLAMDDDFFEALKKCKKENYALIYKKDELNKVIREQIYPMMDILYERFRNDLLNKDESSAVYKHHIAYISKMAKFTHNRVDYASLPVDDIVVDYIASMTDDYLVDLFGFLYPEDKHHVEYIGYFEDLKGN